MKLEKVNDHQIRCTLTKADLADRELKISELAYGTEKAKNLFRDMMQQAAYEFGFEAEDIPLMIEAIPLSADCIVLIITKVEDPEELDTRFSNFAPSVHEEEDSGLEDVMQSLNDDTDNVLDLFKKLKQERSAASAEPVENAKEKIMEKAASYELTKTYAFHDIDSVARVAHVVSTFYFGKNSLYKDLKTGRIILVVTKSSHTPEDFNRVCNMISEYGISQKYTPAVEAYFEEHNELLIKDDALQKLLSI